jgi:2-oxoisovalerate dehydrogenase E1 component alpha subunit
VSSGSTTSSETAAARTAEPSPAPSHALRDGPDAGLVQLLTPDGQRVSDPRHDVGDLSDDDLRALFRDLVLVRRVDTEAIALQRQGELGLWASCRGQEAAQVGSAHALAPGDMVFPTYREHGVAWCRGVDLLALAALFRGTDPCAWSPAEHRFAPYSIVVGSQTLHAVGWALGAKLDGAAEAAVAYFGDGATSQGDVHEAFVWAAAHEAPVVFFCQNNQWAISEPLRRQTRVPLYQRAWGYGFEGVRVDGNDVLATLAVTREALAKARSGGGPTLIEAFTYRMNPHTTSDDPTRYRDAAEVETWRTKDPIARVKAHLLDCGVLDQAWLDALAEEADAVAARLREGTRGMPDPAPETMFDHVLAEPTAPLAAQRAAYSEYAASFLDEPEA